MKVVKTASGKTRIKMSKSEWESIGKKSGWFREAQVQGQGQDKDFWIKNEDLYKRVMKYYQDLNHSRKLGKPDHEAQALLNLKQIKNYFDQNNIQWTTDPHLFEALSDI